MMENKKLTSFFVILDFSRKKMKDIRTEQGKMIVFHVFIITTIILHLRGSLNAAMKVHSYTQANKCVDIIPNVRINNNAVVIAHHHI